MYDPTAVEEVMSDEERNIRYDITARRVRISGLQNGQSASLYSLGGSALASVKADASGEAEIPLNGMSGTTYVIKVAERSFKVTVK